MAIGIVDPMAGITDRVIGDDRHDKYVAPQLECLVL